MKKPIKEYIKEVIPKISLIFFVYRLKTELENNPTRATEEFK